MKKFYKTLMLFIAIITLSSTLPLNAQSYTQGFDDFNAALSQGWSVHNLSNPLGTTTWAGEDGSLGMAPYAGASYAEDDYMATTSTGVGVISDWLISPVMILHNGDSVSFWTAAYNSATYPDRLECRMSTAGTSVNVGTDENSVGDFTTLLVSVNPNLTTSGYPNQVWGGFGASVSGLTGPTQCRIAFRYYVTDAGGAGSNSSTIGLDEVVITGAIMGIGDQGNIPVVAVYPNPANNMLNVRMEASGSQLVNILDNVGRIVYSEKVNNNQFSIDITQLPAGSYTMQIRGEDGASGQTKFIKIAE